MADAPPQTFGRLLRRHRRAAGLTQEALAERAGISHRTVSDLERGLYQRPHRDTVHLLAEALGLTGEERVTLEALGGRGPSSVLDAGRGEVHPVVDATTVTVTCSACGAKNPAGQRHCSGCGSALQFLCPGCGASVSPTQRFCGKCGAAFQAAVPAPRAVTEPPPETTPSREHGPAPPPEERRLVTALFCDLVGFTALSEQLDPEDLRDIQVEYFGTMVEQIGRYGGSVEKYAGDAVLAFFGVPVAREDDPERAVLCALAMQRAVRPLADQVRTRHGVEVALRLGVNTGEVVSGTCEVAGQRQTAVTGDAINVAARLQEAAEPGVVLVGAETMRLTQRRIRYGPERPLSLKGKRGPVPGYAALGIGDRVKERWETASRVSPLIGREREMADLLAAWERACEGEGQLVAVVGEPGVGKSRLLAEALGRIGGEGGARILRGRCLSHGRDISLWLLSDLLRSLCLLREDAGLEEVRDRVAAAVEEMLARCDGHDRAIARDVLGEVLGLPPADSLVARAGPQVRRQSLVRILRLLLGSLAERQPVVLVLEDVHDLDAASKEVLTEVLMDVPGMRLLALAAQRPGWSVPWNEWGWTERLVLRPLGDDEATLLARTLLGGMELSPELREHIGDRAGGNPLFIEELVRSLEETGELERRDGRIRLAPGAAERVPATLAEILLGRLDRLEGPAKGIAQVGSVIGRSFAERLLARVLERQEGELAEPLRALQRAEIAFPVGSIDREYVFKHVLLRDAAYGMLVRRRQRQLHLAVGRAIAQLYPAEEYVETIAYHFARTEEHAEAAEWLERAGDRARDTYADEAAIGHYRGALERLGRCGAEGVRSPGIEEKLGEMLYRVARFDEAQGVLERAIGRYREAGDPEGAARAAAALSHALQDWGKSEEARQRLEGMVEELAGCGPSPAAARLQTALARWLHGQGRYLEMLGAAQRAEEIARAASEEGLRGRAEGLRGLALNYLGRMEEAREALEGALPLLEGAGDLPWLASAVGNLGENRRVVGDLTGALRLTCRALELAVRTGNVVHTKFFHLNLAQILLVTGEWGSARDHLARVEGMGQTLTISVHVAPTLPLHLGTLALREGNWEDAAELLCRSAELAAGTIREVLEEALAALAELAVLRREPKEARDRVEGLVEEEGAALPLLLPVLAWAHLGLGDAERALELAERAEREARGRGTLLYLPEALRIKGMALLRVGWTKEAREVLTEGRERARAMPNPYTEARTLVELGLLDRQEEERERAREQLEEALAIFRQLGARKDIERSEQELAALHR